MVTHCCEPYTSRETVSIGAVGVYRATALGRRMAYGRPRDTSAQAVGLCVGACGLSLSPKHQIYRLHRLPFHFQTRPSATHTAWRNRAIGTPGSLAVGPVIFSGSSSGGGMCFSVRLSNSRTRIFCFPTRLMFLPGRKPRSLRIEPNFFADRSKPHSLAR